MTTPVVATTTMSHVGWTFAGAVAGAAVLAVGAPVLLPLVGLGAVGTALVATPVVGTVLGGIAGWMYGAPATS